MQLELLHTALVGNKEALTRAAIADTGRDALVWQHSFHNLVQVVVSQGTALLTLMQRGDKQEINTTTASTTLIVGTELGT